MSKKNKELMAVSLLLATMMKTGNTEEIILAMIDGMVRFVNKYVAKKMRITDKLDKTMFKR
jgi:predicted peroxiredoxin